MPINRVRGGSCTNDVNHSAIGATKDHLTPCCLAYKRRFVQHEQTSKFASPPSPPPRVITNTFTVDGVGGTLSTRERIAVSFTFAHKPSPRRRESPRRSRASRTTLAAVIYLAVSVNRIRQGRRRPRGRQEDYRRRRTADENKHRKTAGKQQQRRTKTKPTEKTTKKKQTKTTIAEKVT